MCIFKCRISRLLNMSRGLCFEFGGLKKEMGDKVCFYPLVLFPFLRSFFFFCGGGRYFIFVVIDIFGFKFFLDAGGVDDDGCLSIDRALVFTGGVLSSCSADVFNPHF